MGDDWENFGDRTPDEASDLLRQWADEHADQNYHEFVVPLEALADLILQQEHPIQCMVGRHPDLYAIPIAAMFINQRRTT